MEYTLFILILPLLSFVVLGLMDTKWKPRVAGTIGTLVLGTVAALSYYTAWEYFSTADINGAYQKITALEVVWLKFNDILHINLGILLDPISVMMLVVISTVSLMVHIYSLGYMKGEKDLNATTPSCRFSHSRCSVWWWPPTFSKCTYSGSLWEFRRIF